MSIETQSFEALGISYDTPDSELWRLCQEHDIVLITANRNIDGADSLEATIRAHAGPGTLPVITIADPDRLLMNREYAERVAAKILDYTSDLDVLCGIGRLYVP